MPTCLYCQKKDAIENSHVISKFFFEWIKKTSATGKMRESHQPNMRVQDGKKVEMLCSDCEGLFADFEKDFCENIFVKLADYDSSVTEVVVGDKEKKCILSLAWRCVAYRRFFEKDGDFLPTDFELMDCYLEKTKQVIAGYQNCNFNVELLPCTPNLINKLELPKVDMSYYERCVTYTTPIIGEANSETLFSVVIKVPFMILCVEFISKGNGIWDGTNVDKQITFNQIKEVPHYVRDQISSHYQEHLLSRKQLSPKQLEKIKIAVEKNKEVSGSELTYQRNKLLFD